MQASTRALNDRAEMGHRDRVKLVLSVTAAVATRRIGSRNSLNDRSGELSECRLSAGKRSDEGTYRPEGHQTSVCSAISSASSTSIPKYRTVLSSFVGQAGAERP